MKLTPTLLNRALKAVFHHGYGTFFPEPPELKIVKASWANLVLLFANTVTYFSGSKCLMSGRVGIRRIVSDAAAEPISRCFV
jgi:hypothetical protein